MTQGVGSILTPDDFLMLGPFRRFPLGKKLVGFAFPLNGMMRLSVYLTESMEVVWVIFFRLLSPPAHLFPSWTLFYDNEKVSV